MRGSVLHADIDAKALKLLCVWQVFLGSPASSVHIGADCAGYVIEQMRLAVFDEVPTTDECQIDPMSRQTIAGSTS